MNRPGKTTRRTGENGTQLYPEGGYTNVKVVPILGGSGSLSNGTGTCSAISTFSAGMFPAGDLPKIGDYFNISAVHDGTRYDFPRWRCTHSGSTSDFRES